MLRNLNIRQRLLAVYVVFAVLIMALGGFGLYAARANNESIQLYTFHDVESALHAGDLRVRMLDLRRYEKDIVINIADPAKAKENQGKWEEAYGKAQKSFAEIERRMRDPAVAANLAEAKKSLQTYHDNIAAELPKLAGADVATANSAMRAGRDGFMKADGIISTAIELVGKRTAEVKAKFESGYQSVLYVTLALIAVAVVAMVWLGLTVSASIVVPLKRAEDFAAGVRDGDLTAEMQVQGADEAATLSRSLVDMQESLQRIVGNVRSAADSIQVASSEVASGNQDLSHRTEQTAASLQQTASAMNQLTATVNQTADAARTASQLASQASSSAERGGAVVTEVVSTMERINQSSRRIADIIGTIDGIAFQTNILALNAAVEAARAGEQGRGFAVVAGEVRSLAQRSAEAAKEIKSLIGASVESVDNGTRLVADAGATMTEIVGNVQRVTDIIGEISAAAGEQSSGIGSVNDSVVQLDQATQQNAALVEQSAAAAQSLRDQAQKLAEVVSTFRLPGHAGRLAPASPAPAAKPAAKPAAAPRPLPKPAAAKPAPRASAAVKPAPSSLAPAAKPPSDDDWETF
ncbi:methyl-accepting chemotaxis protein [Pseudorhodoferax sp.]|uniref:methyl-accepting chemotaxis protein n=1 Tax=Pseudorhodoferax sp. TaxID=1993553 RepID=UPI002DD684F2|nr:methyl-accepting chemotaxis protein [Pseudorhodoferax sp.]